MKTTQNYGLRKPEPTDFYNVDDFNFNADVIDTELFAVKQKVDQTESDLAAHLNETTIQTSEIVTVGTGGDFTTINQAIEYFSKKYPKFVQGNINNQIKGEIRLKTGFVMREEVHVFGLNLGWIVITSEDTEVTIDRSTIVTEIATGIKGAFVAIRGVGPTIRTLFTMDTTGSSNNQSGIIAFDNARITVLPGCGLKNATLHGMIASKCSHINAELAIATGAGGYGVYAYQLSSINFNGGNARRLPDQDTNQDYVVLTGGIIKKGTGGTNIPVNELTLQGIIFN